MYRASATQSLRVQVGTISNTKVFSASKVNEGHFTYYRIVFPGPTPTQDWARSAHSASMRAVWACFLRILQLRVSRM